MILKNLFAPKISVYKEMLKFYSLNKGDQETVNQWFVRLKSKAVNWKFGLTVCLKANLLWDYSEDQC